MTETFQPLNPDGQPLAKWYSRRIGKPYYSGDTICINVYSSVLSRDRDLVIKHALDGDLLSTASEQILDYYGLAPWETLPIEVRDVRFPTRALSSPIVQISVSKQDIENANDAKPWSGLQNSKVIEIRNIQPFLTYIGTAFKVYEQQLKFFDGSVTPNINFYDLLDKVKLFFKNLESFATFNDLDLYKFKSVDLRIGPPSSGYRITQVLLLDSELKRHALPKGTKYYFDTLSASTNKYVNEMIYNFYDILLGKKSKINWTQFIHDYLPSSGITIDFYGKPRTPTPQSKLKKQQAANFFFGPLATTTADGASVRSNIGRAAVRDEQFEASKREIQRDQQSLQQRLDKITSEIQDAAEKANEVANILNKYNITTLIEAALECLLFKGGFNGSIPDFIPGISPFDPTPPKISLKFPALEFKLPVISINKAILLALREGLKNAALGAVMSMIQTIADIIRELCLTEPNESDQPAPIIPEDIISPEDLSDLYDCYVDFGFDLPAAAQNLIIEAQTSGDVLEEFLRALSPLITARELCDLFNGASPAQALQVISNLIDSTYPSLRANFPDAEATESFFICIGSLVDPSFCFNIYNDLVPIIPEIDPCTIEDTQPFQDIMDLIDGIGPIYESIDTSCGGIIPSLADIEGYNIAVMRLIDSLMAPVQQTFISDLTGFKSIIIQPQPLSGEDQTELDRQRELLEFLQAPDTPPITPPSATAFFNNIIPEEAKGAFEGLQNIAATLVAISGEDQSTLVEDIRGLLASQSLLVAPRTKELYDNIEDNWATNKLILDADTITEAEALECYSFLTNILIKGNTPGTYGRIISYIMRGGNLKDLVRIYKSPGVAGEDPQSDVRYIVGDTTAARQIEAAAFKDAMLGRCSADLGNGNALAALSSTFSKKFYPFAYFSLINAFAYKVGDSDLFNPAVMQKFSLLPKVCATDGSISQADLLDVNKIKEQAFEEFVNNSCIEGKYEMGPVRDAGLNALVNAYLQVLIVDLLLKNIFMVSKFGISFMASSPGIINELLQQALTDTVVYMAGQDAVGEKFTLPEPVMLAAAMVVKKTINGNFTFPISGALTDDRQIEIINLLAQGSDVDATDPALQGLAIRYLFEKRLLEAVDKVQEYFNVAGSTPTESFLLNGILNVEIPDFEFVPYPYEAVWDHIAGPDNNSGARAVKLLNSEGPNLAVLGPSSRTKFFTLFNYINNGERILEKYTNDEFEYQPSYPEISADGSLVTPAPVSSQKQKIEKEVAAFAKYGSVVSERFFKVKYLRGQIATSLAELEGTGTLLDYLSPLLEELEEFFASRTPIDPAPQEVALNDDIPDGDDYLLSFPAFKDMFDQISLLANLGRRSSVWLPIPFYLAGYNPFGGDVEKESLEVAIQLNVPGWESQDPRHVSDYDLIRSFCWAVRRMPFTGPVTDEYYNPETGEQEEHSVAGADGTGTHWISTFSPSNKIRWDYSSNNNLLEAIADIPASSTNAGNNQSMANPGGVKGIATPGRYASEPTEEYTPGTFAIHAGMFQDTVLGIDKFYLEDYPDSLFSGGRVRSALVCESTNFKIVLTRQFSSAEVGDEVIWSGEDFTTHVGLRRKGQEGADDVTHTGGTYGYIDFYRNGGDPEDYRKYWQMAHSLFSNFTTAKELNAASDLLNTSPFSESTNNLPATQISGLRTSPNDSPDDSPSYMTVFLQSIIQKISMGTRLAYLTPATDSSDFGNGGTLGNLLSSASPEETASKYKSYFVYQNGHDKCFAHFATDKSVTFNMTDSFLGNSPEFAAFIEKNGSTQGFNRYVEKLYQDKKPEFAQQLASQAENIFGDGAMVDVSKIMQYLYIIGEIRTYYSLFVEEDMFTDTKMTLLLAIQAALAGSDADATSACDLSATQNMLLNGASSALGPLSNLGQSFMRKILKDTPKHILKGICELCEPHVIVASNIKNVSKTIFSGMEMGMSAAGSAANTANQLTQFSGGAEGGMAPSACDDELGIEGGSLDTPEIPPIPNMPSFDELIGHIQGAIDNRFPETFPDIMKPQVSKEGIDLMGTIPYTMMLPPLTPFGVIYLLLRLADFGQETVELVEDCENQYSSIIED